MFNNDNDGDNYVVMELNYPEPWEKGKIQSHFAD